MFEYFILLSAIYIDLKKIITKVYMFIESVDILQETCMFVLHEVL